MVDVDFELPTISVWSELEEGEWERWKRWMLVESKCDQSYTNLMCNTNPRNSRYQKICKNCSWFWFTWENDLRIVQTWLKCFLAWSAPQTENKAKPKIVTENVPGSERTWNSGLKTGQGCCQLGTYLVRGWQPSYPLVFSHISLTTSPS